MVNLQKIDDSSVKFVFTDSDHYLVGNGEIVVPINSLSLVIDESEMVTFKKSATGDPFISFRADNSNLGTKEAIEEFYKENMVGAGGGISEEEIQDMIDSATSGIPSSQVVEQLRTDVNTISGNTYTKTQIDGFLSKSEGILTTISGDVQTNAANIQDIYDTIDEKEEVIASALTEVRQDVADIDAKEEVIASALTEVRQNVDTLSGDVQTKADLSAVTAVSNDLNTLSGAVIDNEYTVSQSLNDLNSRKLDASAYTPTDLSQYWTSAQTQSAIDDAKAYFIDLDAIMSRGGLTDADWDGAIAAVNAHRPVYIKFYNGHYILESYYLDNTMDGDAMYLTASDGQAASRFTIIKNGSNDYSLNRVIMNFVSDAEKERWNGKQDALSAGSGIEISGNVISAIGGGGVTVDPTLDSGSTNPVANSAITNGFNNYTCFSDRLNGEVRYFSFRTPNRPYGEIIISNFSINGRCPLTKSNGTNEYIDKFSLVETSAITTSMTSSSTDAQVPSAKAVYDTLGGLKLVKISQADYDVLSTKDNDTLYIIPDGDGGGSDWPE